MNAHLDADSPAAAPDTVRLPSKWPHVVSEGDSAVKIYRDYTIVRGTKYRSYLISYFASGKRQRRRFAEFTDAHREATKIAEQKAQGALGAGALTAANRIALEEALTLLAANEGTHKATVPRLIEIVRDYAASTKGLPVGATLAEAVSYFAQRHPSNMARRSVAEVVDEFIADRRSAGCSEIHLRDIDTRLKKQFAIAFALPINLVSAPLVQQWIYGLKHSKTKKGATARTKENMLRQVVALFNFARRMKYVATDLALEIGEIPTPKKEHAPIGIYAPDEIAKVFARADSEIIPALAIAAFAGLRLAEVSRLDWREVRFSERLIVVEAGKAKTAARRLVPISDNLAAWLAPHVKRFGPVNPCTEEMHNVGNALGNRFERAAARAKVTWKRNGFRHSYITYRVATLKDVPAVALECGNSPNVIFSNYRALATEAEGKTWFDVLPPKQPANIIPVAAAVAAP
jgi:integrase